MGAFYLNIPTAGSDGSAVGNSQTQPLDGYLVSVGLKFSSAQAATTQVVVKRAMGDFKETILTTIGNTDVVKRILLPTVDAADVASLPVPVFVSGLLFVEVTAADDTEAVEIWFEIDG